MLRGIYSAAAGMTSQMILTDIMADNLANVNTAGFKHSGVQFKTFGEILINRVENNQANRLGMLAQGSEVFQSSVNHEQGQLTETGNPLDLALQGNGFFEVKNTETNKAYYTRAGNFTRDAEGYVVTASGERVQGANGDIQIPTNATSIAINETGEVLVDNQSVGRLKVVSFEDPAALKRLGSAMFDAGEQNPTDAEKYTVAQGFLEMSNSNVITELVNSMTGLRIYESLQKSIQMQNETLGKSVNEVGKV